MFRKVFLAVLVSAVSSLSLFAGEVSVGIVRNNENIGFDESDFLRRKCESLFTAKYDFSESEQRYFEGKPEKNRLIALENAVRSAFGAEDEDALSSALAALDEFRLNADARREMSEKENFEEGFALKFPLVSFSGRFVESKLLAEKVAQENKCDYMLIPLSRQVSSNLIRVRLLLFSVPDDSFTEIYDSIMYVSEIRDFIGERISELLSLLVSADYGIVDFEHKDYGVRIRFDGEESTFPRLAKKGIHSVSVGAEGYVTSDFETEIIGGELNVVEFDLDMRLNGGLYIDGNGFSYNAFSSDSGAFELPSFFDEYRTPSSISFSYPGFDTKYISLTGDIRKIDVRLKPSYLSDPAFINGNTRKFYTSVLATLGIFAVDIASRSFLDGHPNSSAWSGIRKTSSYLAYFSLSCLFYNLLEYYFGSVYAFE